MSQSKEIYAEFKPASKKEWLEKIERDLKGKAISDLNVNVGGVDLSAFFHRDDLDYSPSSVESKTGWEIGEDFIFEGNITVTNNEVLAALENGVNAPRIVMLVRPNKGDLQNLFSSINIGIISSHFYLKDNNIDPNQIIGDFLELVENQGILISNLHGSIKANNDFISNESIQAFIKSNSPFRLLTVNGHNWFSDSDTAAELVEIISEGEGLLQKFMKQGFSAEEINRQVQFSVGVGKNYFLQIAKIRALKLLWGNILKAYGLKKFEMPMIEAHFFKSTYTENSNSNMIAATTQAMAAIIGGANRLTVLPSDAPQHSSFARRIARNVQHLLHFESYMDRVNDPGAGSYFLETLTTKLAEEAWSLFQAKQ